MNKKLHNNYDMSFEDKKIEVLRIENAISDIVCDDDDIFHLDVLNRKQELLMLLEQRQTL